MTDHLQGIDHIGGRSCPHCEQNGTLHTDLVTEEVTIRTALGSFQTTITYPQVVCENCGEAFTDAAGAAVYDGGIENKRKTFVSTQIRQIREATGLSRAEFLAVTKLGDASLTRWETGTGEPTAAYASFLELLRLPENIQRLIAAERDGRGVERPNETSPSLVKIETSKISLRLLTRTPEMIKRSSSFELRPQSKKAA